MWNLVTDPTIPLETKKKPTQKLGTSQRISYRKLVADLRFRHLFIGASAAVSAAAAARPFPHYPALFPFPFPCVPVYLTLPQCCCSPEWIKQGVVSHVTI